MHQIMESIRQFFSHRFSLHEDRADEQSIIESIRKNVEFKGANLWALIFAIFIASIGLNVNSTAVIIGAMLISPIMGPVMGVGLGIAINDWELVKKGAKNLMVATLISILTSSVYFWLSPLHEAQSELLARTLPSTWDVFIAFFGGSAGMVAASRKERSNVIPGVAIATALMPPLCTAGFGIATGNWLFFLGALYLYFINSVFITLATYLMARYLKLHRQHLEDAIKQKKASRYIVTIVVIAILPSIYMTYRIINRSIFETNARKFVDEQINNPNTQVVSRSYHSNGNPKFIDVLLMGKTLDSLAIDSLNKKLPAYKLEGVKLQIHQGLDARQQIDLSQIKASILADVFNEIPKPDTLKLKSTQAIAKDTAVLSELRVFYPAIVSFGTSQIILHQSGKLPPDTTKVALVHFKYNINKADKDKLQQWLRVRYKAPSIKLVIN
jgi:uncharacterized hydrophobic protein (TIGR00271 family)